MTKWHIGVSASSRYTCLVKWQVTWKAAPDFYCEPEAVPETTRVFQGGSDKRLEVCGPQVHRPLARRDSESRRAQR